MGGKHKESTEQKLGKYINVRSTIILTGLWGFLMICYKKECFIYTSGYCIIKDGVINSSQVCIDLYRMVLGMIGSASFMMLLWLILNKYALLKLNFVVRVLSLLGTNSMAIYILTDRFLHGMLRKITDRIQPSYWFNIIETILMIIVACIVTELIRKSRILNKILLGDR